MYYLILMLLALTTSCGDSDDEREVIPPETQFSVAISPVDNNFTTEGGTKNVIVKSTAKWTVTSDQSWCTFTPDQGYNGETGFKITVTKNSSFTARTANLTFSSGSNTQKIEIKQDAAVPIATVPEGYSLVWQDEFSDAPDANGKLPLPSKEWWFETGNNGWGNNEPQNYVDRVLGTDTVAKIQNGLLIITAIKLETPYEGSEIISARMNTEKSWKYGYFEMRAKVAGGRGTWAAFWMMPKNGPSWPLDGEIDIMEYVGYMPNVTHAAVHTQAYNHTIESQRTGTKTIPNAESDFHVYGMEWTEDKIVTYVDGEPYFTFENDKTGNKETWPFNEPFYLKLNLAIGGNWGGQQGIDPNIFPSRYEIDYVRVYQKP